MEVVRVVPGAGEAIGGGKLLVVVVVVEPLVEVEVVVEELLVELPTLIGYECFWACQPLLLRDMYVT